MEVNEVRTGRIGTDAAERIAGKFERLRAKDLVGSAYDTLFKRLCAEAELQTIEGRRVVAPFAFVSCLAGIVMVLDLVRRIAGNESDESFNYWRISVVASADGAPSRNAREAADVFVLRQASACRGERCAVGRPAVVR